MSGPWRQPQQRGLLRVKTGCKTCRLRKVKCDEGRPACRRCTSAGRVCDGYGVWGGGGVVHSHPVSESLWHRRVQVPRAPALTQTSAWTEEDKCLFDWFRCRTSIKLPGSFISEFWTTLVLQTSLAEPAVLHAVLALSAVHRGGIMDGRPGTLVKEQSALQHYTKAIDCLKPHLGDTHHGKGLPRIALIACILFISLELLSGNFERAGLHLRNGLHILRSKEVQGDSDDPLLLIDPRRDLIDDWVVEAFQRLQLQVQLLNGSGSLKPTIFRTIGPEVPPVRFGTFKEAWKYLEVLMNKILHEAYQIRCHQNLSSGDNAAVLHRQQQIKAALSRWLYLYTIFKESYHSPESKQESKAFLLLICYHTVARIMAETYLQPDDEMAFDPLTPQFLKLLTHLIQLWDMSKMELEGESNKGTLVHMAGSIIDLGWIAPLYFVATKCRNYRIRQQAIRLLDTTSHREGVYDAISTARIVRKVVELEEKNYYQAFAASDGFDLHMVPTEDEIFGLPILPDCQRLRQLEVLLLGTPLDRIQLWHRVANEQGTGKVLLAEYLVPSQEWVALQ